MLNKLYNHSFLPAFTPNLSLVLRELFLVEKTQFYDRAKLDRYQNNEFRKLIIHSYNNVRFYRNWFRKNEIYLSDFKKVEDIKRLPVLTKDIIRSNFKDLISLNLEKFSPKLLMTSGSTGIPFKFFVDKLALFKEKASYNRQFRIYNIKLHDRSAVLRGSLVYEHNKKDEILWKYSFREKAIHFNTFHMNEENCKKIIKKIIEFRPRLFKAYPMALFILSKYIEKYNVEFPFLTLIHFSSESYTSIHRDYIKKQFSCPILDRYGQSEIVLNAYECRPENGYHIEEENNILELLDKNNEQVSEGETGKIIGTNLHNFSMPLIRYSTEDLAVMGSNECECGRQSKKLKSIQGRVLDQIVTEDKSLISGISFYHYWKHRISEKIPTVLYVQIIQPNIEEIIVKIFPDKSYSKDDEKIIVQELKKFVGNLEISFEYLKEIPYGNKWRFTISKISDKF